jgi:hypothetical protein
MEVWVTGYNFESWPFKDHSCHVCFKLAYWFQRFGADLKSNMAARVHNVFSLAEILKIFLLETTKPLELWLCRNDHWVVKKKNKGLHRARHDTTEKCWQVKIKQVYIKCVDTAFCWTVIYRTHGVLDICLDYQATWIVTLQEWSLGGPVLNLWIVCRSEIQDGPHDST